jgi:hypothetical protein
MFSRDRLCASRVQGSWPSTGYFPVSPWPCLPKKPQGGDIEKIGILMIAKLSAYLGEDPVDVAQRHKSAVADYVEFMSQDLGGSGKSSSNEQFVPADG